MFPPDVGGAETYAYELSNALGRAGHNVDVFTMEAATDGEIDVHENVSVTRLMNRRRLVTVDTVLFSIVARRNIDFEAYDVVHGTLMPASTVSFTPGFGMADVPLVVASHGTSIGEMRSSDPHACSMHSTPSSSQLVTDVCLRRSRTTTPSGSPAHR